MPKMKVSGSFIDDPASNAAAIAARQVTAYLAYAMEDVRAINPVSSYLLEMTIVSLTDKRRGQKQ